MRSIQHESIIKLLGFIETNEYYFLILELCQGGELFHQIVHLTYFSEDLARHCISQVAEGIRYLHEDKGIVHRDIKPENLLFEPIPFIQRDTSSSSSSQPQINAIDDDLDEPKVDEGRFIANYGGGGIGKVKIADFGLSKVIWDQQTRTPCGTVGYTAPEIVRNERYTKSVDIYSMGCVLYTMLCGFPPFYDDSIDILTEKVARGHYSFLSPWWDSVSDDAKDLVAHLLCVDPNERYDIHQFMQHPWMNKQSVTSDDEPSKAVGDILIPPSTTTSIAKETIAATKPKHILIGNRHDDLFQNTVSSMKELFDISCKIHRKSEEQAHRKKTQKFYRPFFGYYLTDDDDDDDDDDSSEDTPIGDTTCNSFQSNDGELSPTATTTNDDQFSKFNLSHSLHITLNKQGKIKEDDDDQCLRSKLFDLNLDSATLIGRRKNNNNNEHLSNPIMPLDRKN
ncbi:kinase-like domain-containing protein [Halteromyces radiatus]|uniref:kinase-like domain-containing protein n=1 Tax=Halteromyces radiatus TaxID=101107 RepID=UPI00221FDED2|nr:kinase-like domain-containing protein [Halteromyces radiatus]KAI8092518.1 kinase-like domain-containing protein [Halteromyces radiatus]